MPSLVEARELAEATDLDAAGVLSTQRNSDGQNKPRSEQTLSMHANLRGLSLLRGARKRLGLVPRQKLTGSVTTRMQTTLRPRRTECDPVSGRLTTPQSACACECIAPIAKAE